MLELSHVPMEGLLDALVANLEARGVSLEAWALAWARLIPTLTVVPAFGARLLPPVGRAVLGLALALLLAPALLPSVNPAVGAEGWPVALLREALIGLPVAFSTAAILWAASMAGGLAEELRGAGQTASIPMLEPDSNALGALFGLFAALGFLALGGVNRVVERLAQEPSAEWYTESVRDLVAAIGIALALAGPLLALVIIVEVAGALIARAATPAHIRVLLLPLRAVAVLVGLGLALDAMFRWLLELLS